MNMQFLKCLHHLTEVFVDQVERQKLRLLFGFSGLYLIVTCLLATHKLMWNDELFTFYISRLPTLSQMWSALSTGAEVLPPFFLW
jgi:hypothetical protein